MHSLYDGTHRHAIRGACRTPSSCEECTHCIMAHTGTPYEKQIAFVIDAEVNAAATPESPEAGFHPAPPQLSAAGRSASPGARQISPDLPPDLPRSPHVGGRRSARAPGCTSSGPSRRARGGGRVSARLRERRAPARRLSYTGADLRRSSSERCRFVHFFCFLCKAVPAPFTLPDGGGNRLPRREKAPSGARRHQGRINDSTNSLVSIS